MKTTKILLPALGILVGGSFFSVSQADAFWGRNMIDETQFQQVREYFVNNDFEGFKTAVSTMHETRRTQMESYRNKTVHAVENIDNGIIKTITSDDPEVVAHIQERSAQNMPKDPDKNSIQKTVENIANGVKITITSDTEEGVEHLQNGLQKNNMGRGKSHGGRGNGQGMRGERGQGMNRSW